MRSLAFIAIVMSTGSLVCEKAQAGPVSHPHGLSPDSHLAAFSDLSLRPGPGPGEDVIGQLLDLANLPIPQASWRKVDRHRTGREAIDTLHIALAQNRRYAGTYDLVGHYPGSSDYELLVTRDWPAALSLRRGRYAVDLTPHAGLGLSNRVNSAEAGATLTFSRTSDSLTEALDHIGVRDGAALDTAGRWYVFAAASGRALGLNMQKDDALGWGRSWSTDNISALVGDTQFGLGWRQGDAQTSLGLIHRDVKGDHAIWGQQFKTDSMVALSFSIKPKR
ncbi:MAG: hypothetical protein CGW95_10030 [Phenylobacterium zucineum]|nr:MAG: hypothetical protein CGW95_10030 [Phenylobacterium zucineum]